MVVLRSSSDTRSLVPAPEQIHQPAALNDSTPPTAKPFSPTKVIFKQSTAPRHLLVRPESNASFHLCFEEEDEREAVDDLRTEIAKDVVALARTANGCLVHVV